MKLSSYKDLIPHLPYQEQAFETKKTTWETENDYGELFKEFHAETFKKKSKVFFSRHDLLNMDKSDFGKAVFSIILWGYPGNMRGTNFEKITINLPHITNVFPKEKNINQEQLNKLKKELKGTGMGFSTLSKVFYFFNYTIDFCPCLILDDKITYVLKNEIFDELIDLKKINTEAMRYKYYKEYLKTLHEIANKEYDTDKLELFLYLFGKNLKAVKESSRDLLI